jgi:hypothetical protein
MNPRPIDPGIALLASRLRSALAAGALCAAAGSVFAEDARTECVGYFTIALPGKYEYALPALHSMATRDFTSNIAGYYTSFGITFDGNDSKDVYGRPLQMSREATLADLQSVLDEDSAERQKKRDEDLKEASWLDANPNFAKDLDPNGQRRQELRAQASSLTNFGLVPGRSAYLIPAAGDASSNELTLKALLRNHLLISEVAPKGSPVETVDAYFRHFSPRAPSEVPQGAGFCIPFMLVTGERYPATSVENFRLIDRPDIVITLTQDDASIWEPRSPREVVVEGMMSGAQFQQGVRDPPPHPLDKVPPHIRPVTIDGHPGLGTFALVKRVPAVANTADHDNDWGYFAYVPGTPGLKPGESFNLRLRVERFGRYAKQPLTEKEFREMVAQFAASIKRRPNGWVAPAH